MPPPHLPQHLSHKTALALLPPATITTPIEKIRRTHDKQFHRWPPHINLIYPFLISPSQASDDGKTVLKEDISSRARNVIKDIEPFPIRLRFEPPGVFPHSKRSATVWLDPTPVGKSSKPLHDLQTLLQSEFSECNADSRPFTPHLSVGQASGRQAADVLSAEVVTIMKEFLASDKADTDHEESAGLDWLVDEIHVLERKDFHGRFNIIGSVKLGKT